MPAFFTHYWSIRTWHESFETGWLLLTHTAGSQFRRAGVRQGDFIYVVTADEGRLRLVGRMRVAKIVDQAGAAGYLGRDDLWEAPEHAVAKASDATPLRDDLIVPDEVARQLRFGADRRALVFRSARLDRQTLRSVRRLAPESAALLESLITDASVFSEVNSADLDEEASAPEGLARLRLHKARERNRSLVLKRKELAQQRGESLCCQVCGFLFAETYGKRGEGYIECHHTIPVSRLKPGDRTRVVDLALVCPNCHRMLHWGKLLSIEELREVVRERRPRAAAAPEP